MLIILALCTSTYPFNVVVVVAADDVTTTSMLSETDDIINELIDAELLSTEKSDLLLPKTSPPSVEEVTVDDANEEIILLDDDDDDDSKDDITVDPVEIPVKSSATSNSGNATSTENSNNTTSSSSIHVQSNLQSMSDEELIAICTERGYEITIENPDNNSSRGTVGVTLTHDDYVNAATQCLSLDKVVNQMIADDPDIAADMEHEVERIRHEKEKLQKEQDTILQEISSLEEELRQSGVDPTTIVDAAPSVIASVASRNQTKKNLTDLTVDEVLYESFVQLFDRVGNDIQFVARIVQHIIVQPAVTSLSLIWRYASPTLLDTVVRPITSYGVQHIVPPMKQIFLQIQPYLAPSREMIIQQYNILMDGIILPTIQRYNSTVIQTKVQQRYHHQRDEVQLGIRIVGAFVVPLYQSLSTGYRIFLQPLLHNVTITTKKFLQQQQPL
jgi:hypothetical protein